MTAIKYWVIIPAAGTGQRFGSDLPKQYLPLCGKSILEHTLDKFLNSLKINKVILALNPDDPFSSQLNLSGHHEKIIFTTGGETRCHSVYAGLQAIADLASPQDFVLVHDAVRPCITLNDIDKLIHQVGTHAVGGILGSRVRDTLKYGNQQNEIINTFSRENIWHALTPQMFRYKLLYEALNERIKNNHPVSDEAAAIEALGLVPIIVEGRSDNIKITFPEDLILAEKYFTEG